MMPAIKNVYICLKLGMTFSSEEVAIVTTYPTKQARFISERFDCLKHLGLFLLKHYFY